MTPPGRVVNFPLKDIWPHVLPRIEAMHRRYANALDWKPDDVFQACWNRTAVMFHSSEDDSFCVVKQKYRGGELIMFVWIGYSATGHMKQSTDLLREIARNIGASRIEMASPRTGFDRCKGWRRSMTTYSLEV